MGAASVRTWDGRPPLPAGGTLLIVARPELGPGELMAHVEEACRCGMETWVPALPLSVLRRAGLEPFVFAGGRYFAFPAPPAGAPAIGAGLSRALGVLGLLLTLPLALVVAVVVRVADGPDIFFVQERAGRHGRPFRILKFRTMRERGCATPCVTATGAWLRRHGLDELPQFANMAAGEMALIGPRPLPTADLAAAATRHAPWHDLRQTVRPGLTGLYQVALDRQSLGIEEICLFDAFYVCNRSLRLKAAIVLRTVRALWAG